MAGGHSLDRPYDVVPDKDGVVWTAACSPTG